MSILGSELSRVGRSVTLFLLLVPLGPARSEIAKPARADKPASSLAGQLQTLLDQHYPDDEQRRRTLKLIAQLGSDHFLQREAATRELMKLPTLPLDALKKATTSKDPEVRWRARQILARARPQDPVPLYQLLRKITQQKPPGTVPVLLETIARCEEPFILQAARSALTGVSRPEDADSLRKALTSKSPPVRAASAEALATVLGKRAIPDLHRLLREDRQPEAVRLATATALANLGDRECLPALVRLLSSDSADIRAHAEAVLSEVTGKSLGNVTFVNEADRKKAVERWRAWVAVHGATAKLRFPLTRRGRAGGHLGGHTLLAFGKKELVIEYDRAGKEIWRYRAWYARSAEKLPNGNVLIADYGRKWIVEVDRTGKVVWQYQAPGCENARPLSNGNILVALHQLHRVQEVNRDRKVVWEFRTTGPAVDAHRLANGNTLIVDSTTIKEVTRTGRVVWQHTCPHVYGIQPLANGNILIAGFRDSRVYELTRTGKVVWEFREDQPADAFRLPNGNTLITGKTRFVEVTSDKKIVWTKAGGQWGTARR
jgi:hypothetical protein